MSKFFVQMLLSVMVGVSAALGFSPEIKSGLHAFLHEATNTVVENVHDLAAEIGAGISVKASAGASADGNGVTADLDGNSNVNVENGSGDSRLVNWLPDLSLDGFFANETSTDIEADASNLDVGLEGISESTLDLGFGLGR